MTVLLDTSCAIELFRETPTALKAIANARHLTINVFTLGELLAGVGLKRPTARLSSVQTLRAQCELVLPTEQTAGIYASVQRELRAVGLPMPQNDTWIAATAIEHDLTLLTFDRHFDRVSRLKRTVLSMT